MKYMMMEVYEALKKDTTIASLVDSDRIKFFEAPETLDTSKPFIIIDSPLGPSTSAYFAANRELSKRFSYQINVESTDYLTTKKIAKAVQDVMRKMEFGQLTGGLDTYFAETKRYVDARRYRKNTKIHDTDY